MSEDCSCTEPTPCEHRTSNPLVFELRNPPPWRPLNPQREALALAAADEIERLTAERESMKEVIAERHRTVASLIAERDRLRAALRRYGRHATSCTPRQETADCNCGFREALAGAPDETATAPKVKHETWCASNHLECDCGADSQ